jgi:hypothetical protein
MLLSRSGREKYRLTRVDSINIRELWIRFDDTLDIHLRTQMSECESFDCVTTLHEECYGASRFWLSTTTRIHEPVARYWFLR